MSLHEAGVELFDCEHKTPTASESGHPYIGIPQMKNGHLDVSNARLVSDSDWAEWTRRVTPQPGDVVLSRRTNPGETAVVPADLKCVLGQNLVILRSDGTKVEPGFLRWAVRGPEWWEQIRSNLNVGAVFDSLKCRDIPKFQLTFPPLNEQREIAHLLGALDDKIELNRRMNETLESIARALFKSWFVDFEPVRAKADGRDTGLPSEIDALFPNRLVETENGEVPDGWVWHPIGDVADIVGGTTPRTKEPKFWEDGLHHWASPKDLSGLGSPVLRDTARKVTPEGLAQIGSGLLPPGTVLLSSRAPIGYRAIAIVPTAINQGFIALKPGSIPSEYILRWLEVSHDEIVSRANGSTFLEISKRNFREIPFLLPAPPVLEAFKSLAGPLFEKIASNETQAETLRETRDTLLPELMSGRITLGE